MPSCRNCNFDLRELSDERCPECGCDSSLEALRTAAERWYLSRDGLVARRIPFGAADLLDSVSCRRLALRRYLQWFVLPWVGLLILELAIGSLSTLTVVERWRSPTAQPDLIEDRDEVSIFIGLASDPTDIDTAYVPKEGPPGVQYATRLAQVQFEFRWPRIFAVHLLWAGLYGALVAFLLLGANLALKFNPADPVSVSRKSRARSVSYALAAFGPPHAAGLGLIALGIVVMAVGNATLAYRQTFVLGAYGWLLSVALFLVGASRSLYRLRVGAAHRSLMEKELRLIGLTFAWLICSAFVALVTYILSMVVFLVLMASVFHY